METTIETTIVRLLRQVSFFGKLDEAMLGQIAQRTRRRQFGPHEALFHQGDPGETLYVIVAGNVAIQKPAASGQTIYLAQRCGGEHFGEMALIDAKPRMADAVTVTACDLLMLGREEFIHCIEACPAIALAVMTSLAERLREAADDVENYRSLDVLGRLAHTLLTLAEAQGGPESSGALRLDLTMSQQELADRIGTTRESVSRALAQLRRLKAIRSESRSHMILEPTKLGAAIVHGRGGAGERREKRIPIAHEPRALDAHEQHSGIRAAHGDGCSKRDTGAAHRAYHDGWATSAPAH